MDYYPLFLDLRRRKVLIVGGQVVAWRKAKLLTGAAAELHVVAPQIMDELKQLVQQTGGELQQRAFQEEDLTGASLVFVAVDDAQLERQIYDLATAKNIPINVVDNQSLCTFITPAIVERSPIVVAISSGGEGPVAARRLREKLEAQLPQHYGNLASFMNKLRPQVKSKLPEPQRRHFYEQLYDSQAAQLLAEGREDEAIALAQQLMQQEQPAGMVWLAGTGPGAAAHVTLKTLQLLHQADVILHDRLVSQEILALARRDATVIAVGKPPHSQQDINKMMAHYARQGKQVLRLKGGDGAIFGRLNEETRYLTERNIDHAVAPGITAISAAVAKAGISLTDRDLAHALVFLSLHAKTAANDKQAKQLNPYVKQILRDNAKPDRTLVIYMGVANADLGVAELLAAGMPKDTAALIFEKIDSDQQRQLSCELHRLPQFIKKHRIISPASILIGAVAGKLKQQ